MSKIFNVYLNSTQKISGNNNDATYFIDCCSVLPRGKYRCSFVFTQTGSNISLVAANFENRPALLYFNPGCNSNFSYNSTSRTLNCTNIVGMLNFIPIGTIAVGKGYLYSDKNTNQSFFFNNAILNNTINIKILLLDGTTLWTDTAAAQPVDYIICFSFELIE